MCELSIAGSPLKLKLLENQDSIRVMYKNKVFSGIAEDFFGSQKPKSYIEFKNGLFHGRLTFFFENGNKKLEFTSKNGFIDGSLKSYFDNGNIKDESFFKKGKKAIKIAQYSRWSRLFIVVNTVFLHYLIL